MKKSNTLVSLKWIHSFMIELLDVPINNQSVLKVLTNCYVYYADNIHEPSNQRLSLFFSELQLNIRNEIIFTTVRNVHLSILTTYCQKTLFLIHS